MGRFSVLAVALVAASIPLSGTAFASGAGEISGSAWFDENGDGIRQADERPMANVSLSIQGMWRVVQTDEQGRYRFEDLPDGSYQIGTYITPPGVTETKGGGDSAFDPDTGLTGFIQADGTRTVDLGYTTAKPDSAVSEVGVPELEPGSEVQVRVVYRNEGNRRETLWGDVVFPDGLTPLSVDSPHAWIDGQRVALSSMYQPATKLGGLVAFTITASVDDDVAGELVAKVENQWDVDPSDNVVTVEIC